VGWWGTDGEQVFRFCAGRALLWAWSWQAAIEDVPIAGALEHDAKMQMLDTQKQALGIVQEDSQLPPGTGKCPTMALNS
jgi:hypothetical protein